VACGTAVGAAAGRTVAEQGRQGRQLAAEATEAAATPTGDSQQRDAEAACARDWCRHWQAGAFAAWGWGGCGGRHLCRTQAPATGRPAGGLPSGVRRTPMAAPLPAGAGAGGARPTGAVAASLPEKSQTASDWIATLQLRWLSLRLASASRHFLIDASL